MQPFDSDPSPMQPFEHHPSFDEELFLWLGDEPTAVRAADAARIRDIAA
jgi:hypothetical protein